MSNLAEMVQWATGTEAAKDTGAGAVWLRGAEGTSHGVEGWKRAPLGTSPTHKRSLVGDHIPLRSTKDRVFDPEIQPGTSIPEMRNLIGCTPQKYLGWSQAGQEEQAGHH